MTKFLQIGDTFLNVDHIVKVVVGTTNVVETSGPNGCISKTIAVAKATVYHDLNVVLPVTEFMGEDAERLLAWLERSCIEEEVRDACSNGS